MPSKKRLIYTLIAGNFTLFFGFRIWQAMFNNFAVEELGVRAAQIGLIQSIREIPGLVGVSLSLVVMVLPETSVMALSVILMGLGLIVTGQSHSIAMLIAGTLVTSVGFHFFYSSNASAALMASTPREAPKLLGRLSSVGAAAAVTATVVVIAFQRYVGYRPVFVGSGMVVAVVGLVILLFVRERGQARPERRVVLRRRYWLYYALTFLMGCRRHIFTTFAIFLLVKVYGIPVAQTAILFFINSLINTYAYDRLGRLVARFGERAMLSLAFSALALVFLGYAYVSNLWVLFVLFVLDNILFGFSVALQSYFRKIAASAEEITANVSFGQTVNHIPAVIMPLAGGIIWEVFGPRATFLTGVGIVLVSLVLTQWMRTPQPDKMTARDQSASPPSASG